MADDKKKYQAIVIGASAGGMRAFSIICQALPQDLNLPVIVAQHRAKDEAGLLEELLSHKCKIKVKQADEKEKIEPGVIYFAPPDYHLLIETNRSFSLSCDPLVNYSRPSIDVLFESAGEVYGDKLIGILLTGANGDGAEGMANIRKRGGTTIAQDPAQAEYPSMPQAAIRTKQVQHVLKLDEIVEFIIKHQPKS